MTETPTSPAHHDARFPVQNREVMKRLAVSALAIGLLAVSAIVWARQNRAQRQEEAPQPRQPGWGWLGCRLAELDEQTAGTLRLDSSRGVLVVEVISGTPAHAGGIRENDVVRKMDEHEVNDFGDLRAALRQTNPGQVMRFLVIRNGREKALDVTLGKRPPAPLPRPPELPN